MNSKQKQLVSLVGYLEGECEESQIKLASLRSEIANIESELVGKKERLIQARQALRQVADSIPRKEVSLREAEIARCFGIQLNVGDNLTDDTWKWVCSHRSS